MRPFQASSVFAMFFSSFFSFFLSHVTIVLHAMCLGD